MPLDFWFIIFFSFDRQLYAKGADFSQNRKQQFCMITKYPFQTFIEVSAISIIQSMPGARGRPKRPTWSHFQTFEGGLWVHAMFYHYSQFVQVILGCEMPSLWSDCAKRESRLRCQGNLQLWDGAPHEVKAPRGVYGGGASLLLWRPCCHWPMTIGEVS